MKTLGIVGGIGPESTVVYYRCVFAEYRARVPDGSAPSIIINSIDVHRMLGMIDRRQLTDVTHYLSSELRRLAAAGADLGLLAANSPHIVFDDIARESPIPLISIVQATCDAAVLMGLKNLALFGTSSTMQGHFYAEAFSTRQIAIAVPQPEEQRYIHQKYMSELVGGLIIPETRTRLLAIAERMRAENGIEGVILGGTELSLILGDGGDRAGLPFLDTTKIHARSAVAALLS